MRLWELQSCYTNNSGAQCGTATHGTSRVWVESTVLLCIETDAPIWSFHFSYGCRYLGFCNGWYPSGSRLTIILCKTMPDFLWNLIKGAGPLSNTLRGWDPSSSPVCWWTQGDVRAADIDYWSLGPFFFISSRVCLHTSVPFWTFFFWLIMSSSPASSAQARLCHRKHLHSIDHIA